MTDKPDKPEKPDKPGEPDLFELTRTTDPVTSREAAASIHKDITAIQARVLVVARGLGLFTDRELVRVLAPEYGPSTVRTRRSELVKRGEIVQARLPNGEPRYRIYPPRRRSHIVWKA